MSSPVPARPPIPQAPPIPRRSVLAAGLALPLGLLIAGCSSDNAHNTSHPAQSDRSSQPTRPPLSTRLTLPPPTGPFQIGTVSLHLVDTSRPDPWVPSDRTRQLIIQIWYPADDADSYPRAPYTTPATARAWQKSVGVPVALTLPITDGHLGAPVRQRQGGWPVVLYSHSLGGERFETTCLVEELASRGYVVVTIDHIHDALLLFGRQKMDPYEAKTWAEFWPKQRGPKLALNLSGSTHDTFTDLAALVPQAAPILGEPHSFVVRGIGTINGDRAIVVERTYVSAWFDKHLRGRASSLFTRPSARYPEVRFRAMTPATARA